MELDAGSSGVPPFARGLIEELSLFRQLVEHTHEGVWACDPDGVTFFANRRMAELLRCNPERLRTAAIWDFIDPEAHESVRHNFDRRRKGEIGQHERRYRRADGTTLVALVSASPLTGPDGTHLGSFAMVTDITERDAATVGLAEREARLQALFEHAAVGQILVAPDGRVLHANRSAERMFGLDEDGDLIGKSLAGVLREEDLYRARKLSHAIMSGERSDGDIELRYERPDGVTVMLLASVGVVRAGDGSTDYLTAVLQDVTARRQAEQRLASLAHYDAVTGLANRILLGERLDLALRRSDRVAVLFADLDGFKVVNDTLGHAVGDRLLAAIAERIRQVVRPSDTAARYGGDEFVIVAPVADFDDAAQIAERLLGAASAPFDVDGSSFELGLSIGVAVSGDHGTTATSLMRHADLAMYEAKDRGGSCWVARRRDVAADPGHV